MSSPWNRTAGQPEVPPDVPPEYADAYLAGFQRGLGGLPPAEIAESAPQPEVVQPDEPDEPDEADAETDEVEEPAVEVEEGTAVLAEPTEDPEPSEPSKRSEPSGTDLEWLFDRRETGPPGWTAGGAYASSDDDSDPTAESTGATSVAGKGPRSPWPMLGAFLVVLALLMLLAYLGGMAFSTIMNR